LLTWKDIPIGAIVTAPGSAKEYRTGDWRSQRPVWDLAKCIKCGLCYIYCPDASIGWKNEEGYPWWDEYHCKGCGICAQECWTKAIHMEEETE